MPERDVLELYESVDPRMVPSAVTDAMAAKIRHLQEENERLKRDEAIAWGIRFCCEGRDCGCKGLPVDPPPWWRPDFDTELAQAKADGREEMLHNDQPWSLVEMLNTLAAAVDHCSNQHNCDCHGYERTLAARDAARELVAEIHELRRRRAEGDNKK